ncbi:MAG: alanine racemase, partial [Bacteroidetes bacterium]|nr:alanine racemase [Bacteroidota bacterium]
QTLAAYHRSRFNIPVIGITGSNGKTIVKEWLNDLLHKDFAIVRSPRSFNSQVGVPLSVWLMNESHSLGIFEAGISQMNEMERLQKIIKPTIGILTNIGEAHNEGFSNKQEKLREKLKLFRNCTSIIYCSDVEVEQNLVLQSWVTDRYNEVPKQFFNWSKTREARLTIKSISKSKEQTIIDAVCRNEKIKIAIPFADDASIENAITCWCVLLSMNIKNEIISEKMNLLRPVNMRLELKKGINHCTIINDSYSADISSLNIALNFLDQQNSGEKRTAILSDFLESGQSPDDLYKNIADIIHAYKISRVIAIGPLISKYLQVYIDKNITAEFYLAPDEFKNQFRFSRFRDEIILVKGARVFEFEEIVHLLEQKVHQTVLEIDLNAISHNLKQYQQLLKPSTKVMAMVKAFAYGSGGAEIAGILQFHKVDYLGVAYADEGVELRKAGINLPIMVLNAEASTFESILNYNLEPDIYSFELLRQFDAFLVNEGLQQYPVHLEIETGMNRLGFSVNDIPELINYLNSTSSFKVES